MSFFTLLKEELKKVSEFYLQSESGMLSAYKVSARVWIIRPAQFLASSATHMSHFIARRLWYHS